MIIFNSCVGERAGIVMDEDRRLASYKLEQKDFIIEVKKAEAREQKPEVGSPPPPSPALSNFSKTHTMNSQPARGRAVHHNRGSHAGPQVDI